MPIFVYECIACRYAFEEIRKFDNSGKSVCPKCGYVAFKIPAIFNARIFKKREFGDGTSTPDNISTHSQEKAWKKQQGITYEPPIKKKKKNNAMETAFKEAHDKVKQGFKIENPQQNKNYMKGGLT
jgi:putative FmdB family regulatory protein